MSQEKTYELKIDFAGKDVAAIELAKSQVMSWLMENGVSSFVEGVIDNLNLDFDYDTMMAEAYEKEGGAITPVSVFSYDVNEIDEINRQVISEFGDSIKCSIIVSDSIVWQEGWKEGFKPIETDFLYVLPPWIEDSIPHNKKPVFIDPGMAFGTGQHATTLLCLVELEKMAQFWQSKLHEIDVLDVGTGSGILVISAVKLGFSNIIATDIDKDSLKSAKDNFILNGVDVALLEGTIPSAGQIKGYNLIFANILAAVLKKIMIFLADALRPDGRLVLSGILIEEEEELIDLAAKHSLKLQSRTARDGWACLNLEKTE